MQAQLEGIQARRAWVTYLGAVGGCLDHLGVDISTAWLYGGIGWAFIMNMDPRVDVGSPIAWDGLCVNPCQPDGPGMMTRLEPNLGYTVESVCSCPHGQRRETDAARERAWDLVRRNIDEGTPCFGFELAYPEFFIIPGYTDEGYLFLTPGDEPQPQQLSGPRPWREVGPEVQWIRFGAVKAGSPAPDEVVVRDALQAAVARMSRPPAGGPFVLGLEGYDLWAAALEEGRADGFGHRYNAASYAELRTEAVAFLREAQERLSNGLSGLFDEAIGHYAVVADRLQAVHALHPFQDVAGERIESAEAAELVRQAGAAERQGLAVLGRSSEAMG